MRLIDADALSARLYHEAFETDTDMQKWDSGCWIRYKMFKCAIDEAPTIEPKQGEWIKAKPKGVISYAEAYAECDQCHEVVFIGWSMNFCPFCGARMKGTDDE